jgi:hypothetical protein
MNQNPIDLTTQPGMSLRDYFAAKALNGILASETRDHSFMYPTYIDGVTGDETTKAICHPKDPDTGVSNGTPQPNLILRTAEQNIAHKAYALADAMLTTRHP